MNQWSSRQTSNYDRDNVACHRDNNLSKTYGLACKHGPWQPPLTILDRLLHSLQEITLGVISLELLTDDKSVDANDYYNLMTFAPTIAKGSRT